MDAKLKELAAPLEALRPQVESAYLRLEEKWSAVIDLLSSLPIPCDVSHKYSWIEYHNDCWWELQWRKYNGQKRLCDTFCQDVLNPIGEPDTEYEVTPYEEWSAERRMKLLEHVPGLFKSAEKQVRDFIKKIEKA